MWGDVHGREMDVVGTTSHDECAFFLCVIRSSFFLRFPGKGGLASLGEPDMQ